MKGGREKVREGEREGGRRKSRSQKKNSGPRNPIYRAI